jgi:Tetratricopeptide repeat
VEELTNWHRAGVAFARGDVERAVEVCTEIGVRPNDAYMRLRAAERLLDEGRPEAAERTLQNALEFYRSVSATAYIQKAEGLLSRGRTRTAGA